MDTNPATYFAPFAERLEQFVIRHNLAVDKYRHDMARWSLLFEHPLGGVGRIEIGSNGKRVSVQRYWDFNDYDRHMVLGKSASEFEEIKNPDVNLESGILDAIKSILGWTVGELKHINDLSPGPHLALLKSKVYPKVRL